MPSTSFEELDPTPKDHFEFDYNQLMKFCERFQSTPAEDHTEAILEVKLRDLEAKWNRLDHSYEKIMLTKNRSITKEDREEARVKFEVSTESFYQCSSQILDLMKICSIDNPGNPRLQSTSRYGHQPAPQSNTFLQDTSTNCIKLPPCDTEVFNGSYEQWPSFRDMFTAVYINHAKLNPVTRLYHLRNKTRGEAGAIVKRYPLSHENFELAWNALKTRYENKRVLVDNQIKILFDIPAAKGEDSESIRRIQSSVNDSLATLITLGVQVESWDPILIRLISTKLPDLTLSLWEQSLTSPRELPKWSQMSQFLVDRYEAIERLTSIRKSKNGFNFHNKSQNEIQTYVSQENLNFLCKLCKGDHPLRMCQKFKNFTTQQRVDFVFKNKICNNCLSLAHLKINCKSKNTCLFCKKSHHTLLHMRTNSYDLEKSENTKSHNMNPKNNSIEHVQNYTKSSSQREQIKTQDELPSTSKKIHADCSIANENILLRTALMQIEHRGELFTIRALIDPGSQRTFISEKIRHRLQLPYKKSQFEIIGIGGQKQSADKECELTLYAKRFNIRVPIKAIVMPKVTKHIPSVTFAKPLSHDLEEIDLADPNFNKSAQIDLIIGNDHEHAINIDGIRKNVCGQTSAYNTIFGWVLSGPITTNFSQSFTTSVVPSDTSELNMLLKQFWEQEEIPAARSHSSEDEICEKFYSQTTLRLENGRYMVRLPFRKEFPDKVSLGSSRFLALAQYTALGKTLSKKPELEVQYKEVLNEYLVLDHMEETTHRETVHEDKYFSYYLPHHAVVRPEHKTTKVRVVFNASRKTKSEFSLNDILYTGPTLQNDLIAIILNWRKYKYVFSGDIQKMYRQILVHPEDRPFQRILWQRESDSPIQDFQLKTVAFGVNCAPYLAIRTLRQIASDVESELPEAANILRNETYVDDILSGGYSLEETISAQNQVIQALKSAGLPLKKITANKPELLAHIKKEDLYDSEFLRLEESSSTKTLGIKWNALLDTFTYRINPIDPHKKATKRQILSSVAKLFDPAGWLAPIVISAKIIMQQLWLEGLDWDDEVSSESLQNWNNFVKDLSQAEAISIPRWLQYMPTDIVQIHGFSDASKTAYCATLYIRCQTGAHSTFSNLLVAKSKVAPIQTVCLPRLELCGAVLLAKLVNYTINSLKLNIEGIHLWTDSSIVLGWLSKTPSTWETYVANRASQIHTLVPNTTWRYVPTHDNPADLGTRGIKPQDLVHNTLWWHGPSWLHKPSSEWPKRNPLKIIETPNNKVSSLYAEVYEDNLNRFSSYDRALRVLAYAFRFFNNSLRKLRPNMESYSEGNLTHKEIQHVKSRLIKLSQKAFYENEYNCLLKSEIISDKSPLKSLNPILDSNYIMRVNGRLTQSSLPYNERYPIILPGNSRFCKLYLIHLHKFLYHAECSQMCRMAQTEFFIFRLKPRVKKIVRQCKTCTIYRQQSASQIMAPLPPERCTLTLPFQTTGIDFAGPFDIKTSPLRKAPSVKGYMSVFVCFSTRAIHLELCSDLSSAAFQAAFARFVGRRGLPKRVVTDNGRNFLGASRALEIEFTSFVKNVAQDVAQKYITHGFEWKFIPPHAPHMGGLWEAAVKSFKFHLKRVAGSQKFTFEEFATILSRIEGILNSRPISALSEDPTDLTALTPSHFLRGAPIMALPEGSPDKMSLVNRWEKLKAIQHQFAIRWREDYLRSLHRRYKWKNPSPNMRIGDLVVVIDDLLPPHEWRLGRIEKTYPGSDDNVRTADVRIATGIITRPIVKLCYLPVVDDNDCQANRRLINTRPKSDSEPRHERRKTYTCELCRKPHSLRICRKFLEMSVGKRENVVNRYNYCSNCLARNHDLRACTSRITCKICNWFHHTLFHPKSRSNRSSNPKNRQQRQNHQKPRKTAKPSQPHQPEAPTTSTAISTTPSASNVQVIVEAIKSLANVLSIEKRE